MTEQKKGEKDHDRALKAELLDDKGVSMLCAAIVEAACDDYLRCRKMVAFGRQKPAVERATWELESLDKFFHGSWYGTLCDLDPDIILAELDAQFEEYARSRR